MAEELKIVIDADVSKAQAGLESVSQSAQKTADNLGKVAPAANSASVGLDSIATSTGKIAPNATTAANASERLVTSFQKMAPAATQAGNSISTTTQKSTTSVNALQTGVSKLGATIDILKDKIKGKQALIDTSRDIKNIEVLTVELEALKAELLRVQGIGKQGVSFNSDALISGANAAFSALRKIAFILPGIGVAGILGGLSDVILDFGKKLFGVTDDVERANTAFDDLTKTLTELKSVSDIKLTASGTTQGDIELVNALAQAIKDTNLSYGERKIALEQLQSINKSFFGALTLEADNFDALTDSVNKYTQAIIAAAVVEGFKDEIKKLSPELQRANKAFNDNVEAVNNWQKILKELKASEGFSTLTAQQQIEKIGDLATKNIDIFKKYQIAEKAIVAQTSELQKARGAYADLEDAINGAVREQLKFKPLKDPTKEVKTGLDGVNKGLTEVQRKTIDLAKFLSQAFNVPIDLKFTISDSAKQEFEKAKAILKGIEDHTIRLKVISPDDIELPKLKPEIDAPFFKKQLDDFVKRLTIPLSIELDEPSLLEAEDKITKIFSAFSQTNIFTEAGRNAGQKFSKALVDAVAVFQNGFKINPNLNIDDVVNSLKQSLAPLNKITLDLLKSEDFKSALRDLERLHDAGVAAGEAAQEAFLKAGLSAEDAAKGAQAIIDSFGGITQGAADAAEQISSSLGNAVGDLINAFASGQNPAKAFFNSIIQSLTQVIAKIVQAQIEQIILNSLFKAATAAFNPLSILGLVGFEKGGDPPVGRPSIVGEKGPELIVPRSQMHVFSHEQSKSILSSSVREHESLKQYFITEKIAQSVKDYFRSIDFKESIKAVFIPLKETLSESFKSVEKFTYKLSDKASLSVNNLQESFIKSENHFENITLKLSDKLNQFISSNLIKDSSYESQNQSFEKLFSSDKIRESINNKSFYDKSEAFDKFHNSINSTVNNLKEHFTTVTQSLKTSVEKITFSDKIRVEKIINNNFFSTEKFSSITKSLSHERIADILKLPKFATGGAVFAPTLALLGEGFGVSRSNPEFVGTREQLKGIQGGTFDLNLTVGGDVTIGIDKLAIALNAYNRSQLRTSGKKGF